MDQISPFHLQNPPMARTSLRVKADVFPMAYMALNYLALGLVSHIFQSHWLRCYSWKTGLECLSSSDLQQGIPGHHAYHGKPYLHSHSSFAALLGTYPLPAFCTVFLHILFIVCGLFQECKVHESRGFLQFFFFFH